MAKFYGPIGYGISVEKKPGVWVDEMVERNVRGDVIRNNIGNSAGNKANMDLTISNSISILADEFAVANASAMKYLTWRGVRWVIAGITIEPPRLVLRLGEVYDGPTP